MSGLGLDGLETLVPEGIPKAGAVLILVPPAEEKDQIAAQFLLEGLRNGDAAIALESEAGIRDLARRLGNMGFDADKAIAEGRFIPLDWFAAVSARTGVEAGLPAVQAALAAAGAASKVFAGLRIVIDISGSLPEPLDTAALDPITVKLAETAKSLGALSLFLGSRAHGLGASLGESFRLVLDLRPLKPSGLGLGVVSVGGTPLPRSHMVLATSEGRLVLEAPKQAAALSVAVECPVCRATIPAGASECPICRSPRPVRRPGEPDVLDYIEALGQRVGMQEAPIEAGAEPAPGLEAPPERPEPGRRGLTNGLAREGLKAPAGRTNGLTNGLAGRGTGKTNGLAGRGTGKTNGLAGRGTGKTNGLVNGIASAKRGLTNGLTNGNGFTNGLGSKRFASDSRKGAWRVYLIPFVATVLLIVAILPLGPPAPNYGIDGDFSDWTQRVPLQSDAALPGPIDLTAVAIRADVGQVFGFIETREAPFLGSPDGLETDALRMFMDVDNDADTGYRTEGIGAEYMVTLAGARGAVVESSLMEFPITAESSNWSAWLSYEGVDVVVGHGTDANRIEFSFARPSGRGGGRVLFEGLAYDGKEDVSEIALGTDRPVLVVEQVSVAPAAIAGTATPLLEVRLRSPQAPVVLTSLRVTATGTYPASGLTSADLLDSSDNVLATAASSQGGFKFDLSSPLSVSTTEQQLQVEVSVDTGVQGALGLTIEKDSDVHVQGADVLLTTLSAARDRAYVGAVPSGVVIDGAYGEWPVPTSDPTGEPSTRGNPNVDVTAYDTVRLNSVVAAYAAVAGRPFYGSIVPAFNTLAAQSAPGAPGAPLPRPPSRGEDTLRVFIDSDANPATGYVILVGGDYMVELVGRLGAARTQGLFHFTGGSPTSWSWQRVGEVDAAIGTRQIELLVTLPSPPVAGTQVVLDFRDWRGGYDRSDVLTRSGTRSPSGAMIDAGTYTASLPADLSGGDAFQVSGDRFDASWRLTDIALTDDAGTTRPLPLDSDPLVATESVASYELTVGGVSASLEYGFGPTSLKEELVLSAAPDGLDAAATLRVRFSLGLSAGASLLSVKDLPGLPTFGGDGDLAIVVKGEAQALFPRPFMIDADARTTGCAYELPAQGALDVACPADALRGARFPLRVDPSTLFQLNNTGSSSQSGDFMGWSVAIGDFNKDGYADVLTGAPFNDKNASDAGLAHMYFGPFSADRTTPNVVLIGNGTGTWRAGYGVAAGDFNNDGYSDAVVGQQNGGPTRIYYGRANWPAFEGTANVSFAVPSPISGESFGRTLVAGNFDGSGGDDLVIGRPLYPASTYHGRAYVYFSPFSSSWIASPSLTLAPFNNTQGRFGYSLATGRIDSDTKDDLIVGEIQTTPDAGVHDYGRISLYKGSSLTGSGTKTPDKTIISNVNKAFFGYSVAVGKLNGDDYADVAVGASHYGAPASNDGRVYVYLAKSDGTGLDTNQSASNTISSQSSGENFGFSVAIGDYYGDGTGDIVVGAEVYNSNQGRVYEFNNPLSDQTVDETLTGSVSDEHFGHIVALGKYSNDPGVILAISGPYWDDVSRTNVGRVVVGVIPEFPDLVLVVGATGLVVVFLRRRWRHDDAGS